MTIRNHNNYNNNNSLTEPDIIFTWLNLCYNEDLLSLWGKNGAQGLTERYAKTMTFDTDLRCGLDDAQRRWGHTRIVGRLPDIGELQHIPANRHLILPGQLQLPTHPLQKWHGGADCNTRQVNAAPGHHLLVRGRDGEAWRHASYCRDTEELWGCWTPWKTHGGWADL